MEIKRAGTQPSAKGPADWFTGTVRIDPLIADGGSRTSAGRERHLRAGRTNRVAYASAGANADCHCGLRVDAALGRDSRGDPAGRRGVDCSRREALAWRSSGNGDDAHRHPGKARWQDCGLAGACERRTISQGLTLPTHYPCRTWAQRQVMRHCSALSVSPIHAFRLQSCAGRCAAGRARPCAETMDSVAPQ